MTNAKVSFIATLRNISGKKTNQLRRQGQVPANIMGKGIDPTMITVGASAFNRLYDQVGDNGLIYLEVTGEDKPRPVLVDQVAVGPVSGIPIHVVFKQVDLKEKINAEIPVEVVGEFDVQDALLLTVHDTIEVEALPTDLPEKFEINIAGLTEVGQAFTFKDLEFDRSKITLAISEEEWDTPILLVQEVKEEVEPEEPTEVEGAEGETPADTSGEAETTESDAKAS